MSSALRSPSLPLLILAFGAIGAVVINAGGCTVLTNDGPPDDAGVFEGGDANIASQACSACVVDQCTSAMALCLSNDGCNAIRTCSSTCTDAACRGTCACAATTNDGGISAESRFRAFTSCNDARTCAQSSCATDCASSCTTPPSTTPPACGDSPTDAGQNEIDAGSLVDASVDGSSVDASGGGDAGGEQPVKASVDACASCGDDKCGDAKKACAIGSECAAFLSCAAACTDATCSTECGTKHATGKSAAQELASCVEAGCSDACGLK